MGIIVGTRTWGGVVGMKSHVMADGTCLSLPIAGYYTNMEGGFEVENKGVTPDITVE